MRFKERSHIHDESARSAPSAGIAAAAGHPEDLALTTGEGGHLTDPDRLSHNITFIYTRKSTKFMVV